MLKRNLFLDAPFLAVTEKYRRHPETLKIEALVLTCIVRVSNSITIIIIIINTSNLLTKILIVPLHICIITQAHPMASAKWSKGGSELDATRSSERQEIDRTVLEIVNPSQDDLGVYTCEASNSEGKVLEVLTNKENNLIPAATKDEPKELVDATEEEMGNAAAQLVNTRDNSSSTSITSTTSLVLLIVMKSLVHLNYC